MIPLLHCRRVYRATYLLALCLVCTGAVPFAHSVPAQLGGGDHGACRCWRRRECSHGEGANARDGCCTTRLLGSGEGAHVAGICTCKPAPVGASDATYHPRPMPQRCHEGPEPRRTQEECEAQEAAQRAVLSHCCVAVGAEPRLVCPAGVAPASSGSAPIGGGRPRRD